MPSSLDSPADPANPEILERIERAFHDRVRPELQSEGSEIELVGVDPDTIVQVRLTGACQGCSSSVITLSMWVESILREEVPEIRFVEVVP